MARSKFFNVEHKINNYVFYKNEQNRVYVPDKKEEFEEFLSVLFGMIENPTEEQTTNYNLILMYPFLLPKNRWDLGLSIGNDYGFDFTHTEIDSMPEGWYKAFGKEMLAELKAFLFETNEAFLYKYMINDIKEKYGGLRWYDNGLPKGGYEIIHKYEELSYKTCIKCGKPATHMTDGWIMALCDECDTKKEK